MVQTDRPDKRQHAHKPVKNAQVPNRRDTIIACVVLLAVAIVGLSLLIYFGQKITANDAALYTFVAQNLLSLLVFLAVVAQALIYFSQRNLMHRQWKEMEKQALSADKSVVFGLRVLFHIENIGKVPAKNINVFIEIEVRIPEKWTDEQSRQPPWVQMGNRDQSLTWKINHDYGRVRLSPGSLGLTIPVALDSWLSNAYMFLIWEGKAKIFFRGNIGFHDGFHRGKNSPFSFLYDRRQEAWIVHPILTQADIEQKLAERAKQSFGDRDPLSDMKIIDVRQPPLKQAKAEKKKGENKGKPN
jgi:hypothetical protein